MVSNMRKKIIILFIVIISILLLLPITVNADIADFTPSISEVPKVSNNENLKNVIGHFGILMIIARFVAVIALIVIGIKYVMASAQEKADLKGKLVIYTIGVFVIFAASFIMSAVLNTLESINT